MCSRLSERTRWSVTEEDTPEADLCVVTIHLSRPFREDNKLLEDYIISSICLSDTSAQCEVHQEHGGPGATSVPTDRD